MKFNDNIDVVKIKDKWYAYDTSGIGQGGFAKIYEAKDKKGNLYALKAEFTPEPDVICDNFVKGHFRIDADDNLEDYMHPENRDAINEQRENYQKQSEEKVKEINKERKNAAKMLEKAGKTCITEKVSFDKPFEISKNKKSDKIYFTILDYCPGNSLAYLLEKDREAIDEERFDDVILTEDNKLMLAIEIIDKLSELHEKGIVHADIKPDNIMVDIDENGNFIVNFVDFGFAKDVNDDDYLGPKGTNIFMAPELIESGKVSTKTDLYALGVMLSVFTGKDQKYLNSKMESLGYHVPELVELIDSFISSALNTTREDIDETVLNHVSMDARNLLNGEMDLNDAEYQELISDYPHLNLNNYNMLTLNIDDRKVRNLKNDEPKKRPDLSIVRTELLKKLGKRNRHASDSGNDRISKFIKAKENMPPMKKRSKKPSKGKRSMKDNFERLKRRDSNAENQRPQTPKPKHKHKHKHK